MFFWLFMLFCSLLTPFLLFVVGWTFHRHPVQKRNRIFGYRTKRSMKNPDTWQFAQDYFSRLWYKLGLLLLPVSVLVMLLVYDQNTDTIGLTGAVLCLLQCVPMLLTIWQTERMLAQTFDADGHRRTG